MKPERIAFIGLGALGAPMATNLIRGGYALTLHNRNRDQETAVIEALQGFPPGTGDAPTPIRRAASPAEAVADATIVCLCLSDDAAVREVMLGKWGGLEQLGAGCLVIDFSTVAPATSQALSAQLAQRQVAYLDAPVTGGTEGARAGTLSVLVGGEAGDLARARPLLEVVGGQITHLGPAGAGQQAKAVNQVLVAGSYAAVAEALALGQRLGLPMDSLVEALKGGAAGSWALENRAGNMLKGHFPLGFKLALHRKDLAIALATAHAADLELPVSTQVAALEDALIARGHGGEDVSALARWFT